MIRPSSPEPLMRSISTSFSLAMRLRMARLSGGHLCRCVRLRFVSLSDWRWKCCFYRPTYRLAWLRAPLVWSCCRRRYRFLPPFLHPFCYHRRRCYHCWWPAPVCCWLLCPLSKPLTSSPASPMMANTAFTATALPSSAR